MVSKHARLTHALARASELGEAHLGRAYFEELLLPLLERWACLVEEEGQVEGAAVGKPLIVSLSGLPGTGKSTFARLAEALSESLFGVTVASLSLDDVYLTQFERGELAQRVHPLLATRGVPGTHDLALLDQTLQALEAAGPLSAISLPRFDKILDDRLPQGAWPVFHGRPHLILVDGWFFGTQPGAAASLGEPHNDRERFEDADGRFRAFVHAALASYQGLFRRSNEHVHFEAPSFEASVFFRIEQGRRELERRGHDPDEHDPMQTRRFLELFERVATWPRRARDEWIVKLDDQHRIMTVLAPTRFAPSSLSAAQGSGEERSGRR